MVAPPQMPTVASSSTIPSEPRRTRVPGLDSEEGNGNSPIAEEGVITPLTAPQSEAISRLERIRMLEERAERLRVAELERIERLTPAQLQEELRYERAAESEEREAARAWRD